MAVRSSQICASIGWINRNYTGLSDDLELRLKAHNNGQVPPTSKYRSWRIETAIAFSCPQKAANIYYK
jgi:putative endonuclease